MLNAKKAKNLDLNQVRFKMEKFKLPRKIKKQLKKRFLLYPEDEEGNSQMAFPWSSQEDYSALKNGLLRDLFERRHSKLRKKEYKEKMDKAVSITDEELKEYVNKIIRKDLRNQSYDILIRAKNNPNSIRAYYNFINAYHLYETGNESMGSICCLAIDLAKELLQRKRKK